ncbi:MAG: cell division protein FtsA, partial [Patescibacteria group bacterium]
MAKTRVLAGIDIGSAKIASLVSQYDELEDKISISGVGMVPSRGVRKGQIVDIDEAAAAVLESVEQAERMAGYSLDQAFVTISGGHIDSRNSNGVVAVADPGGEISGTDIERVIEAARAVSLPEAREIIHVLPKEYKVDGETQVKDPEGMSGVRLEVETHLITGSTTAVKNIQKTISEVGVTPTGMVFSGLSSAVSVLSDTERELGVVLVDVGAGTTSIVVYVEGSIAHSSVLPIGGKNVTNDIAAGLRVSLDSAEKIKITLSEKRKKGKVEGEEDELDLKSYNVEEGDRKISEKTLIEGIIKPRLNEIFTMVGMNLSESQTAGKTPS